MFSISAKTWPGVSRLSVQGEKGTKITMQHGELQKANGRVEMGNIDIYYKPLPGLAFQTDTYTLKAKASRRLRRILRITVSSMSRSNPTVP